jgi:septal ring factor EnvC (AmiA/AmiB activator)
MTTPGGRNFLHLAHSLYNGGHLSGVGAAVGVLQGAQTQPLGALIGGIALIVVAIVGAYGAYWGQSRRFERLEADVAQWTRRQEKVESDLLAIRSLLDALQKELAGYGRRLDKLDGAMTAAERRLDQLTSDVASHTHAIARVAADLAAASSQANRLTLLETDLILFFTGKNASTVTRVLVDTFTDEIGFAPPKAVQLANYLQKMREDPLMHALTEPSWRAEDIKKKYEELKRKLTDAGDDDDKPTGNSTDKPTGEN